MAKKFHIQGPCLPNEHYMADTARQQGQIKKMIAAGDYFIINRPRQYGKTTALSLISRTLQNSKEYLVIPISFEGIGDKAFEQEDQFCHVFLKLIARKVRFFQKDLVPFIEILANNVKDFSQLSVAISDLVDKSAKKVVLLIDEVDRSSNNELFLSFLGVLRDKYIQTQQGWHTSFRSVILAGVHDIKTLKLKIPSTKENHQNSPWDIAAKFKVDMNLLPTEIMPMLQEYAKATNTSMDVAKIAQTLYEYTAGYPFLVSKICKVIDEDLMPQQATNNWTIPHLEVAISKIIKEDNFNFDSLVKNLENHPALFELVYRILLGGEQLSFNIHSPTIKLGVLYGIFKIEETQTLGIHNKVYEQVIYNYMLSRLETAPNTKLTNAFDQFVLPNYHLDMEAILRKFQEVMKEEHSDKDQKFIEREGRLLFLSFLKPIINGKGYTFKEPQISAEKRLDVVITYFERKYIVELKIWYGAKAHQKGLNQLADYLHRQQQDKGWLVIFEHQRKKTWQEDSVVVKGKEIFVVWV